MTRNPWVRASGSAVASALGLVLAGACTRAAPSADRAPAHASLAGAWRSNVTFSGGVFAAIKDLQFLYVFNAGGTMTESSNYDEAPPVTPAYGVWREIGPNQYEAKYVYFNTKAPAKFTAIATGGGWQPDGYGVLTERFVLDASGAAYESTITLDLFDAHDKPVPGGGRATTHGVRISQ